MKIRPASWDCTAWHCCHAVLGFAHPRNHLAALSINIHVMFANQDSGDIDEPPCRC